MRITTTAARSLPAATHHLKRGRRMLLRGATGEFAHVGESNKWLGAAAGELGGDGVGGGGGRESGGFE